MQDIRLMILDVEKVAWIAVIFAGGGIDHPWAQVICVWIGIVGLMGCLWAHYATACKLRDRRGAQ